MKRFLLSFFISFFVLCHVTAETINTHYYDPIKRTLVQTTAHVLTNAFESAHGAHIKGSATYIVNQKICTLDDFSGYNNLTMSLRVSPGVQMTLIIADGCTLKAPYGIFVDERSSLTIVAQSPETAPACGVLETGYGLDYGDGEMAGIFTLGSLVINGGIIYADGAESCAGIGLGKIDEKCASSHQMSITINGGKVTANGGEDAAGIGGQGRYSVQMKGEIKITGGGVVASSQDNGAGIGGGYKSSSCKVTISGGVVEARGGESAAGIGGGSHGGCGDVVISGGRVQAYGGDEGAGIGSGDVYKSMNVGSIKISGGQVEAYAGSYQSTSANTGLAAGIGTGDDNTVGIPITISGGKVSAYGARLAACIGGGESCGSGQIVISGGHIITFPNKDKGQRIGPGYDATSGTFKTIAGGHAIIETDEIYDTSDQLNWWFIWFNGGVNPQLLAGPDTGPRQFVLSDSLTLTDKQTLSIPPNVEFSISAGTTITGGGILNLVDGGTLSGDVYGGIVAQPVNKRVRRQFYFSSNVTHLRSSERSREITLPTTTGQGKDGDLIFTLTPDDNYQLPYIVSVKIGGVALSDDRYQYDRDTGRITIPSREIIGNVTFDAKGFSSSADGFKPITPDTIELSDDVYIVNDTVTINHALPVHGSSVIFSQEGSKLTVNGGMVLDKGALLLLLPLDEKCGEIVCHGSRGMAGITVPELATFIVKDARLTAIGSDTAAGIGGLANSKMGTIHLQGGTISATGGDYGAGIGGGNLGHCNTIKMIPMTNSVLNVTAVGGRWATGIGGGYKGDGGDILIEGGTILAKSLTESDDMPGIGASKEGKYGTFSTTSNGTALIRTTVMKVDRANQNDWRGIIFETAGTGEFSGCVYGDQTLDCDLALDRSDCLLVPKETTLKINQPYQLTGRGYIDLSEGGRFIGDMGNQIKVWYDNELSAKFIPSEMAGLSRKANSILSRMLQSASTLQQIEVYHETNASIQAAQPVSAINRAVELYDQYLDDYLVDCSSSRESSQGEKVIQVNQPKFNIRAMDIDSESARFVVSVEGAKLKRGVSASVWMSQTPHFSQLKTNLILFPALDFELSADRTMATFHVVKPPEMHFFKVVLDPAPPLE